jgi:hypothetical protein
MPHRRAISRSDHSDHLGARNKVSTALRLSSFDRRHTMLGVGPDAVQDRLALPACTHVARDRRQTGDRRREPAMLPIRKPVITSRLAEHDDRRKLRTQQHRLSILARQAYHYSCAYPERQ